MSLQNSVSQSSQNPVGNKLIAALPKEEYERLLPKMESISLCFKQALYLSNEPIEYVYFPNSGIISLLTVLGDGGLVEVATVGNEGMIGTPILLGVDRIPAETVVQVPGDRLRMKVDVFRRDRYHRGKMTILDRQGLEAGSCECYQVFKEEYKLLLGWPSSVR